MDSRLHGNDKGIILPALFALGFQFPYNLLLCDRNFMPSKTPACQTKDESGAYTQARRLCHDEQFFKESIK